MFFDFGVKDIIDIVLVALMLYYGSLAFCESSYRDAPVG